MIAPRARALLDANLLMSYLLSPGRENAPTIIVRAAVRGAFRLILADPLLLEVRRKAATKPYLAQRIAPRDLDDLWATLLPEADPQPPLYGPFRPVGRDRDDDHLLALAEQDRADFLVTRDKDLLVLAPEVMPLRIVSPGAFLRAAELV